LAQRLFRVKKNAIFRWTLQAAYRWLKYYGIFYAIVSVISASASVTITNTLHEIILGSAATLFLFIASILGAVVGHRRSITANNLAGKDSHIGDTISSKKHVDSIILDDGEASIVYSQGETTCSYTVFHGPMIINLVKSEWPHVFKWSPLNDEYFFYNIFYRHKHHVMSTRMRMCSVYLENIKTIDSKKLFLNFELFFQVTDVYLAASAIDDPIGAFKAEIKRAASKFLEARKYEDFLVDRRYLNALEHDTFKSLREFATNVGFQLSRIVCSDHKLPFSDKYLGKIIRKKESTKRKKKKTDDDETDDSDNEESDENV